MHFHCIYKQIEKDEPKTHEEKLSRVKDFFNKSGGMPPMIRPKPKPLKKPTPAETSESQENKAPGQSVSPISPDQPEVRYGCVSLCDH